RVCSRVALARVCRTPERTRAKAARLHSFLIHSPAGCELHRTAPLKSTFGHRKNLQVSGDIAYKTQEDSFDKAVLGVAHEKPCLSLTVRFRGHFGRHISHGTGSDHLYEGCRADPSRALSDMSPAWDVCTHVATDL